MHHRAGSTFSTTADFVEHHHRAGAFTIEPGQVDTGQPSGAFDSEAEAKSWIENESEAWLKKHPKNRQRQ
jgi:hypothetical protein